MSLPAPQRKISGAFLLLLFITLGVISYWPSFFGERIWDDHFLIGENPFFRSPFLLWECFQHWMYPFSNSTYFRPMQHVSYMLDYWIWGDELFGYHFTNVLIHAGAAFLLGFLLRRIAKACLKDEQSGPYIDLLAFGAAALWLIHPIHHAGIAYISGRADSLAALFSIGAWLLCERGLEAERRQQATLLFGAAAILGWLALCSKEIALTWFGLFALYHTFLRSDRMRSQRILPILAAGILVLFYAFHRKNLPQMTVVESEVTTTVTPFAERFILMLKALGDYVSLILCPVNLHMERTLTPSPEALQAGGSWLKFHSTLILPLGILALLFAIWLCIRRSPNRTLYRFAITWFFLGFLPISNLFPLNAQVAEHWIYMSSIPIFLLIVKGLQAIPLPHPNARSAVIGVICAILVLITHEQSRYWVTEENFLHTTIARGGDTPRIRVTLARLHGIRGDIRGAEALLRDSLEKHPEADTIRAYLSALLLQQGRKEEAAELVTSAHPEAVRSPIPWTLEETKVRALVAAKREAEAQEVLTKTLSTWPLAWDLVSLQAALFGRANEPTKAIELLSAYVQERWWHYAAVMRLAQSFAAAGRYHEALEKYELAAKLDIRAPKPYEQIAAIRFTLQRPYAAIEAQREAVKRAPDSNVQKQKLAQLQQALSQQEEAEAQRREMLRTVSKRGNTDGPVGNSAPAAAEPAP